MHTRVCICIYVFTIIIQKNLERLTCSYIINFSAFHCIGKLILPRPRTILYPIYHMLDCILQECFGEMP